MTNPNPYHWHQPLLVPTPAISARINLHLDGPRGTVTLGWSFQETATEELLCLGTSSEFSLRTERSLVTVTAQEILDLAVGSLTPF